jgi:flagellar FliL protein
MLALEDKRTRRRPSRWRLPLVVLMSLAMGAAGFGLAVTLNAGPAPQLAAKAPPGPELQLLDLEEMYVNLRDDPDVESPADRLMRIRIGVLYDLAHTPRGADHVTENNRKLDQQRRIAAEAPKVKDLYTAFLRQLSVPDLEGSRGTEMLKTELLKRARLAVGHDGPREILISELIIQ